jgi:hypothetical protein
MPPPSLSKLLVALGYADAPGFIRHEHLNRIARHRHALREAFEEISVVGVFSLTRDAAAWDDFVPLVYVAVAEDAGHAREIHRLVWSQGVVPFLLISCGAEVWCCNGLAFATAQWDAQVPHFAVADLDPGQLPPPLAPLTARALRTSLVWNDQDIGFQARVDRNLLANLRALVTTLTAGTHAPAIPRHLANAMVGRFLFVRCLADRRVLPPQWLPLLDASRAQVPLSVMWESFSRLDRVFNGSVFPLTEPDRLAVNQAHLDLLVEILLRNGEISSAGVQLSFKEISFSVVRTETLSAVYELFLSGGDMDSQGEDGAFYTPPFLVDYVLAKVEQLAPLTPEQKVFDCAAGSGLFLVGAFRRIVESRLAAIGATHLPLADLHELLTQCIWGVERNADACHVAALSLYLTMLDYVSKSDLRRLVTDTGRQKVFPSVVGRTLLSRDFFDRSPFPRGFPAQFDVIVANPPWQKVREIGGQAIEYNKGPRGAATDQERAAGLFFWKAWDEHLRRDGRFGFLLHARMLVSSGAKNFPSHLIAESVGLTDVVNFSHMRRKLFPGTEAPTVLLCGVRDAEIAGDRVRVFSPLLSSQPLARDRTPWAIFEDAATVEVFPRAWITTTDRLVESATLRPVDRLVLEWLRSQCRAGKAAFLSEVMDAHELEIKRGGTEAETGVPSKWILGADYRARLGLEASLLRDDSYALPESVRRQVRASYRDCFGGSAVIIPRSMVNVDYVARPMAFNSSLNALYARSGGSRGTVRVLKAIAEYLRSGFARYCYSLIGRDWNTDARRLEQKELKSMPVPYSLLENDTAAAFETAMRKSPDAAVMRAFGLPASMRAAFEEFDTFRCGFLNGRIPDAAHASPTSDAVDLYTATLEREMAGGREDGGYVAHVARSGIIDGVAAVLVEYRRAPSDHGKSALRDALARIESNERDLFHDSGMLAYDRARSTLVMLKPWSRSHWTVERAYLDSERMMVEAMTAAAKRAG